MKIEIEDNTSSEPFKNLEPGEVFMYSNIVFMKLYGEPTTEISTRELQPGDAAWNAVRLSDGSPYCLNHSVECVPCDAELLVRKR